MRFTPIAAVLAAGIAAGLCAYGVSPSQYAAGRAQDAAAPSLPVAPQARPLAPGQSAPAAELPVPGGPVDYGTMGDPAWAKAWAHYDWPQALALWHEKGVLFCDARDKMEYDQAHIPGAIPLPLDRFEEYYHIYHARIRKARRIVTYCHGAGCQLSNKVAQLLWKKGYRNVGSFFGGWPQWQQHNMPVSTGPGPKP